MGNDPVNNVDPDGGSIGGTYRPPVPVGSLTNNTSQVVGQFSGTAQSTSVSAGASGTSGSSSISGGFLNGLGITAASALGQYVVNKLLPMPSGPDARQLQACSGGNPASSGTQTNNQQPLSASEQVVNAGNDCNCPPGYSSKPNPNKPNDKPYFFNPDDAAIYWAYKASSVATGGEFAEYSSQMYSLNVKNGKTDVTLYSTTIRVRFPGDKAYDNSPGPSHSLQEKIPARSTLFGHLHFHWIGSEEHSKGTRSDNRTFSSPDQDLMLSHKNLYFYVLGSRGVLDVKYPDNLPLKNGWPNTKVLTTEHVKGGFYNKDMAPPKACHCYKE